MLQVENLVKHYARVRAVDGVSFGVGRGEVLGLLGPNGAGKTTALRCILDIVKPDSGSILLMGRPFSDGARAQTGYLPEERGLYRGVRLLECLTYLAALKGLSRKDARRRAAALLERVGLAEFARRPIKELSKGMTQKAQFLAAIVHDPALLLLDEPFQGLDPVNTELLRSILLEEQARGKTIVLSTHDMDQVEELCDRILLIDHGRTLLYGPVPEIRARYADHSVIVECDGLPEGLPGVARVELHNRAYRLHLEPQAAPRDVLAHLVACGTEVRRFELASAPLEEVFIRAVEGAA